MDQIKIGRFIAEQRKLHNLTQASLAQTLGITDRAVSKWERGKGMPDVSLMPELCEIFGITVNELLCGERITMDDSNQKNQQLMLDMAKEIERKNKTIWSAMWTIMIVCIIGLLGGLALAAFVVPEGVWQLVAILASVLLFLIPCFYALKLEVSVGAYQCKYCGHKIVPTYKQALMAMHAGTTRYFKCPQCGKQSWCKKVINP